MGYYLEIEDGVFEPMNREELRIMVANGDLTADDIVQTEDGESRQVADVLKPRKKRKKSKKAGRRRARSAARANAGRESWLTSARPPPVSWGTLLFSPLGGFILAPVIITMFLMIAANDASRGVAPSGGGRYGALKLLFGVIGGILGYTGSLVLGVIGLIIGTGLFVLFGALKINAAKQKLAEPGEDQWT